MKSIEAEVGTVDLSPVLPRKPTGFWACRYIPTRALCEVCVRERSQDRERVLYMHGGAAFSQLFDVVWVEDKT